MSARTASFQLSYIVTGEPAALSIERTFPPAPILLSGHNNNVTLWEGQLVLIGLLEDEARLDQQVSTAVALWHILEKRI